MADSKINDTLAAIEEMEKKFQSMKDGFQKNIQMFAAKFAENANARRGTNINKSDNGISFADWTDEDSTDNDSNDTKQDEKHQEHSTNNDSLMNVKYEIGDKIKYKYKGKYEHCNAWYQGEGIIIAIDDNIIKIMLEYGSFTFQLNKLDIERVQQQKQQPQKKNRIKALPQRFFFYGTLRDDDDSGANWTKNFIEDCIATNAKLYGFKLYKNVDEDWPFAIKSNNKSDYIVGRLTHWDNGFEFFKEKLKEADEIEDYEDDDNEELNIYQRDVFDVVTDENQVFQAIVYYQKVTDLQEAIEIPSGDWLQRP